jgi:hypothetical protein
MNNIAYSNPYILYTIIGSFTESFTQSWTRTGDDVGERTITEPTLCDGYARLSLYGDPNYTNPLPWSTTETFTWSSNAIYYYSDTRPIPSPSCSINPSDCLNLASALNSGYYQSISEWETLNVVTVSLASPPVSVVVNGQTTAIGPPGSPYVLTIHNATYSPIFATESVYVITDADFVTPYDKWLTPGGQLTATWGQTTPDASLWDFNFPCQLPATASPTYTRSECYILAGLLDLLYFAPPPTTRDLCASTSPGYNRCKVFFSLLHPSGI